MSATFVQSMSEIDLRARSNPLFESTRLAGMTRTLFPLAALRRVFGDLLSKVPAVIHQDLGAGRPSLDSPLSTATALVSPSRPNRSSRVRSPSRQGHVRHQKHPTRGCRYRVPTTQSNAVYNPNKNPLHVKACLPHHHTWCSPRSDFTRAERFNAQDRTGRCRRFVRPPPGQRDFQTGVHHGQRMSAASARWPTDRPGKSRPLPPFGKCRRRKAGSGSRWVLGPVGDFRYGPDSRLVDSLREVSRATRALKWGNSCKERDVERVERKGFRVARKGEGGEGRAPSS